MTRRIFKGPCADMRQDRSQSTPARSTGRSCARRASRTREVQEGTERRSIATWRTAQRSLALTWSRQYSLFPMTPRASASNSSWPINVRGPRLDARYTGLTAIANLLDLPPTSLLQPSLGEAGLANGYQVGSIELLIMTSLSQAIQTGRCSMYHRVVANKVRSTFDQVSPGQMGTYARGHGAPGSATASTESTPSPASAIPLMACAVGGNEAWVVPPTFAVQEVIVAGSPWPRGLPHVSELAPPWSTDRRTKTSSCRTCSCAGAGSQRSTLWKTTLC